MKYNGVAKPNKLFSEISLKTFNTHKKRRFFCIVYSLTFGMTWRKKSFGLWKIKQMQNHSRHSRSETFSRRWFEIKIWRTKTKQKDEIVSLM